MKGSRKMGRGEVGGREDELFKDWDAVCEESVIEFDCIC